MVQLKLIVHDVADWDVRGFFAHEAMSSLFDVAVTALHLNDNIDLESLVGAPASFAVVGDSEEHRPRLWQGVCSRAELVQAEPTGLSTYQIRVAPKMWLTKRKRQSRIFRGQTLPEIVQTVLGEYGMRPQRRITEPHEEHECRVQYQERDFELINRLLEEEGISYYFAQVGEPNHKGRPEPGGRLWTELVLSDKPERAAPRDAGLAFMVDPSQAQGREHATAVRVRRAIRMGQCTIRDFDFVNPDRPFFGRSRSAPAPEDVLEHYRYDPSAFIKGRRGAPRVVDDKEANRAAQLGLESLRNDVLEIEFETNAVDLAPGAVVTINGHPRQELAGPVLVTRSLCHGTNESELIVQARAAATDRPWGPARRTRKPVMHGPQSATVVRCWRKELGQMGEERIHTDKYGRICVKFHWETEGR